MMRPAERTTLRRARLSCLVLFTYEVQILPVRMLWMVHEQHKSHLYLWS